MDIVKIAPENLDIANAYLQEGSAVGAAQYLGITPDRVHNVIDRAEVKTYINSVYLDQGYRNRFKLAELLDTIIEKKLEEAKESEMYTSKDIVDLIALAHKMTTDYSKEHSKTEIKRQTNVQINSPFGEGNYGKLMERLLGRAGEE